MKNFIKQQYLGVLRSRIACPMYSASIAFLQVKRINIKIKNNNKNKRALTEAKNSIKETMIIPFHARSGNEPSVLPNVKSLSFLVFSQETM